MNNRPNHICICGIGPGNPDFIVKPVFQKVANTDVIIGGKRQLSLFARYNKDSYVFDGKVENLKACIQCIYGKDIVILVSGDTGFYSLRRSIVDAFPEYKIELIPGISSFQYFYAQLGLGYEKAFKASMHGTEMDYINEIDKHESVFLLTDKKNNWKSIAQELVASGFGDVTMHIGNRLSYNDETIISTTPHKAISLQEEFDLCAVIIEKTIQPKTKNQ